MGLTESANDDRDTKPEAGFVDPPAMGYRDGEKKDGKDSSSWKGWQVFPDEVATLQRFEYGHDAK